MNYLVTVKWIRLAPVSMEIAFENDEFDDEFNDDDDDNDDDVDVLMMMTMMMKSCHVRC